MILPELIICLTWASGNKICRGLNSLQVLLCQVMSSLTMESMAYITYSSNRAGSQLQVVGDLKFQQKTPLAHIGTDTRFNVSVEYWRKFCIIKVKLIYIYRDENFQSQDGLVFSVCCGRLCVHIQVGSYQRPSNKWYKLPPCLARSRSLTVLKAGHAL